MCPSTSVSNQQQHTALPPTGSGKTDAEKLEHEPGCIIIRKCEGFEVMMAEISNTL